MRMILTCYAIVGRRMKCHKKTLCKSVELSISIIGVASTIAGIPGYTVRDIIPKWSWWRWPLVLLGVFIALSVSLRYFRQMIIRPNMYNSGYDY